MNYTILAGVVAFSAVAAFTPGPNNLLALTSGASYGFRKTLPHVAGVALGFGAMIVLVGVGIGALFETFPVLYSVLKYCAIAYLLWLAYKIARSGAIAEGAAPPKPLTFWGSAAFQWINPKGWVAALTVISTFTDPNAYWSSLFVAAGINVFMAVSAVSTWAGFGVVVSRWLSSPRRRLVFNITMAVVLVASVIPSLWH